MSIWGKNKQTGRVEKLDEASKSEAYTMAREYQLAFGRDWIVWVGLKRDEPGQGEE